MPTFVYTDGGARGNGQRSAVGGIGVYFGPSSPLNFYSGFQGDRTHKVTNQTMELLAATRGLEIALRAGLPAPIEVCTDSEYTIKCATVWARAWERNGWLTKLKKPVENKELVQALVRAAGLAQARFTHVPAHRAAPGPGGATARAHWAGNREADRLATLGIQVALQARAGPSASIVTMLRASSSKRTATTGGRTLSFR